MARTKTSARTHFLCRECGAVHPKWMGRCPDCGAWDALERFTEPKDDGNPRDTVAREWSAIAGDGHAVAPASPIARPLPDIETLPVQRWSTGLAELDRVLGGGFVPGSVTLLGGDPGIGKSTLLMQAAAAMAATGRRVLYATSEESAEQVRLRAERLFRGMRPADPSASASGSGSESASDAESASDDAADASLDRFFVLADTNLTRIAEQARQVQPDVCVIDSIQMVYRPEVDASPGSPSQLRQCGTELVALAKVSGMAVVMVGHVTKDGQLAGPKLLEHLVDSVLSFEGDAHHAHRIVRGVKNRFGTTLEVGLFEMTGAGLREVNDVGRFREDDGGPRAGSVVVPVMHGTRAIPVEIQALTATGILGSAKRKASGLDGNRLAMIIAVLEQHGGLRLMDQDVFVSTVGGLRVVEPAADLAIALAIAGAHRRRALPAGWVVAGEVGLGGEIRAVQHVERRRVEAQRLGYAAMAARPPRARTPTGKGIDVHPVLDLRAALALLDVVPADPPVDG